MNVLRWVVFIPSAVLLSEIVRYFGVALPGGLYVFLLPETFAMLISDGFVFLLSGVVFVVSGYAIGPSNKALVLRVVNICAIVYYVSFAVLVFFLARIGVAGSFWYPLLLSVSALGGVALGNSLLKSGPRADSNQSRDLQGNI